MKNFNVRKFLVLSAFFAMWCMIVHMTIFLFNKTVFDFKITLSLFFIYDIASIAAAYIITRRKFLYEKK